MGDRFSSAFDRASAAPTPDLWPDITARKPTFRLVGSDGDDPRPGSWRVSVSVAAVLLIVIALGTLALSGGPAPVSTEDPSLSDVTTSEPADTTALVPNIVGLSVTDARRALGDAGLTLVVTDDDAGPGDTIVGQAPQAGRRLPRGAEVGGSTSESPDDSTTATTRMEP